MFLMRFTERAYTGYTEDDVRNSPNQAVRLTFSNSHFDPKLGAELYNEYLDEYEYSEEVGFDGLMLNEHHSTPTCMGATMNLEAAIPCPDHQEAQDSPAGNPLPVFDNPIRLAEELAEIDMISRDGWFPALSGEPAWRAGRPTSTRCTTANGSKRPMTW